MSFRNKHYFDKIQRYFDHGNIDLHCRHYLKPVLKQRHKDTSINNINIGAPCLFINGRVIIDDELLSLISDIDEDQNTLFTSNNVVLCAYLRGEHLTTMKELLKNPPSNQEIIKTFRSHCVTKELTHTPLLSAPWDLIALNEKYITKDFNQHNKFGVIKGHINPFASIYNENNVFIDHQSTIEDFVVINAENGPVYIEDNVYVEAHTRLEGPLYIGSHSRILGGNIKCSSIGKYCKISGEVSHSIFQGYSNKAHGGFIGHSYINEWVNLGAFTTTSNLKNTYGNIAIQRKKESIQTHLQFLGSLIGDHVKTSIGTTLNCGSTLHFGACLFDHKITQKEYLPYSWGPTTKKDVFKLEKFLSTAKIMMERRGTTLSPSEAELFEYLFNLYCKK